MEDAKPATASRAGTAHFGDADMKRRDGTPQQGGKSEFMLRDCVDLDALEQNAQRVMRPESWVFCDTGADDEITAKENVAAWRKLKLRPRVLRDIVEIDTSVSLLGAQGEHADHGGADRPASPVPCRTASAPPRAARRRPARSM